MIFLLSLFPLKVQSQALTLTLNQLVKDALAHNLEIQISRNEAELAANNVTPGAAGMLPRIGIEAAQNNSISNIRQEFLNGNENRRDGATTHSFGVGPQATWTFFDGLVMVSEYRQLQQLAQNGQLRFRLKIEEIVNQVASFYFTSIQIRQQIRTLEIAEDYSSERYRIAELRQQTGSGAKTETLQALVDFNTDKAALLEQKQAFDRTLMEINRLTGRPISQKWEPDTLSSLRPEGKADSIFQEALSRNRLLLLNFGEVETARYQLQKMKREKWPKLTAQAGYDYNKLRSQAGFLVENENFGVGYGFGLSIPLFNGFNQHRQTQNAKIVLENAKLTVEDLNLEIEKEVLRTVTDYAMWRNRETLERQNVASSKENLTLALEKYKQGLISGLEYREIQRQFAQSENNLVQTQFNAKLAEHYLLLLTGRIPDDYLD